MRTPIRSRAGIRTVAAMTDTTGTRGQDRWRRAVGVVAIPLTFAVGGACGDDGLGREELVARGDAICAETERETGALFGKLFPTGSETPPASEAAPIMREALALLEAEADELAALDPAEDVERYESAVAGFRDAVAAFETSVELAEKGEDEAYLQELQKANEVDAGSRETFKSLGFSTCAGEG